MVLSVWYAGVLLFTLAKPKMGFYRNFCNGIDLPLRQIMNIESCFIIPERGKSVCGLGFFFCCSVSGF